ncbi:hypothetical protein [Lysobacter sp. TAB13]|uniref:hypothetical protein n=1 Tax=Lysobacter sp. TAB13 TaxID=3233065 RepID=UPI003F9CE359
MHTQADLPVLDQFCEDDFADCVFKIENLRADEQHYYFRMSANYDDQIVAVDARLVKTIGPGFDSDMKMIASHVYRDGLVLSSIGAASDRLIGALARLYGVEPFERIAAPSERYTVIALQQENTALEAHAVRMKLFGRDQDEGFDEDDYYESFFHVDLPTGYVYWNEKDQDYREPLLRAWTATTDASPA